MYVYIHARTYARTHTRTHTHTHTHAHTRTHTSWQAHGKWVVLIDKRETLSRLLLLLQALLEAQSPNLRHICGVQLSMRPQRDCLAIWNTKVKKKKCSCPCVRSVIVSVCVCVHTYIHVCIHTCMHTHMKYAYTYASVLQGLQGGHSSFIKNMCLNPKH